MKKILSFLVVVIVAIIGGWIYVNLQFEKANDNPFGLKEFTIAKGDTVEMIGEQLRIAGFVDRPLYFNMYVALRDVKSQFMPGTYVLDTRMSVQELVTALLKKDQGRQEVTITIIEGWKLTNIAEYLEAKKLFNATDFMAYVTNPPALDYDFLKNRPDGASLEGFLYPDTYKVYSDATPAVVVDKMLQNFGRKLTPEIREQILEQKKTIFDVVTLASVVEKEMFGYEDRRVVAGIFLARLADKYPLQSDATVNYLTERGTTRPSLEETQIDNPYNSYRYAGLPPGPICNPSIEAINAVINPAKTDYYFFLTTPDNKIIYSRNHDEHIANRNKYLD